MVLWLVKIKVKSFFRSKMFSFRTLFPIITFMLVETIESMTSRILTGGGTMFIIILVEEVGRKIYWKMTDEKAKVHTKFSRWAHIISTPHWFKNKFRVGARRSWPDLFLLFKMTWKKRKWIEFPFAGPLISSEILLNNLLVVEDKPKNRSWNSETISSGAMNATRTERQSFLVPNAVRISCDDLKS